MESESIRKLIKRYGGLHAARNALAALQAELIACEPRSEIIVDAEADCGRLFMDAIGKRADERFAAIFVDQARMQVGGLCVFEGGSRTRTTLYPRILFGEALKRNATGIIMSHNHPSGTTHPSPQDRDLTRRVNELGQSLEVTLIDHLIVTTTECVSFRKRGWL